MDKLYVPKGEMILLFIEDQTYKVVGHFGVENIDVNLQNYVHIPKIEEYLARFIRGCIICYTRNPSNRNQGL